MHSSQDSGQDLWEVDIDSDPVKTRDVPAAGGETIDLAPWSVVVLRRRVEGDR